MKTSFQKTAYFKQVEVDENEFTVKGIFSTDAMDRHGEVIDQKGWILDEYLENPVILYQHESWKHPIAKCIALSIIEGQLVGVIKFAVKEDKSGLSETIFNLYKGGYMRAFSVGFECMDHEYDVENEMVILKQNKLYEISCVSIPANAEALASQKGINVDALHAKDFEHKKEEPNEAVEPIKPILKSANIAKYTKKSPVAKGGKINAALINRVVKNLLEKKNTRKINQVVRKLLDGKKELKARK